MASAYISRTERNGTVRHRVSYRLGGREARLRHGGSFGTQREAKLRKDWINGELAAGRVPDLGLTRTVVAPLTLKGAAEQWRASRVDVADGTAHTYRVNLERIIPRLGERALDTITPAHVSALIAELHEAGLKRESISQNREHAFASP